MKVAIGAALYHSTKFKETENYHFIVCKALAYGVKLDG